MFVPICSFSMAGVSAATASSTSHGQLTNRHQPLAVDGSTSKRREDDSNLPNVALPAAASTAQHTPQHVHAQPMQLAPTPMYTSTTSKSSKRSSTAACCAAPRTKWCCRCRRQSQPSSRRNMFVDCCGSPGRLALVAEAAVIAALVILLVRVVVDPAASRHAFSVSTMLLIDHHVDLFRVTFLRVRFSRIPSCPSFPRLLLQ